MTDDLAIVSASVTDRGLSDKRPQNEDSFVEMANVGVYAVADGVGGAQGGDVASQMAMEILSEAFTNRKTNADTEDILKAAIERANSAIYQMAQELPKLWNMATTIVALHIDGNIATIGHVGDSRLYRIDRNGDLHQETDDHSMVADEVRAGRMTIDQAEIHPNRNVINRAVGVESTVTVDLKTIMIEPGTDFLLCTDGITRHVTDDEIGGAFSVSGDPVEICEYLKDLCYERGAEDNLTAVIVKVGARIEADLTATESRSSADNEEDTIPTARLRHDSERVHNVDQPEIDDDTEYSRIFTDTDEFPLPNKDGLEEGTTFESRRTAEAEFSMFRDFSGEDLDTEKRGIASKAVSAIGLLLIGSLIGFGVYHFLFLTAPLPPTPQLSEMKSDNVAMTSYEKLRRTVDSDPAAYIREAPPSEDAEAEDFYLRGRAYLLTNDFLSARLTLLEAQKRLPKTDALNAQVLATDIAAGLAIANEPAAQKELKTERENASKLTANINANR